MHWLTWILFIVTMDVFPSVCFVFLSFSFFTCLPCFICSPSYVVSIVSSIDCAYGTKMWAVNAMGNFLGVRCFQTILKKGHWYYFWVRQDDLLRLCASHQIQMAYIWEPTNQITTTDAFNGRWTGSSAVKNMQNRFLDFHAFITVVWFTGGTPNWSLM